MIIIRRIRREKEKEKKVRKQGREMALESNKTGFQMLFKKQNKGCLDSK